MRVKYVKILHNVEVDMGFTQLTAKDSINALQSNTGIQLTCTMAIGYRKCTITSFDWTIYLFRRWV